MKTIKELKEHIVKVGSKYRLVSKKTGKNLGTYSSRAGAEKRERQVQYFKHMGEEQINEIDRGDIELSKQSKEKPNKERERVAGKLHHGGLKLEPDHSKGHDPYNRNPFKQFREELIGLARPKGRVSGSGKTWNPPRRGKEHKAGKETWAVHHDVQKQNKKLGIGVEKNPETTKSLKKKINKTSSNNFYKTYLSARPPRN